MSLTRLGSAATRRQIASAKPATQIEPLALPHSSRLATTRETPTATEEAFEPLVQYFPAETITLFLAAIALWNSLDETPFIANTNPLWLVAVFALITPLMVLFVAYATFAEQRRNGAVEPDRRFSLPTFELVASALAFIPWGLAVPGIIEGAVGSSDGSYTVEMFQALSAFLAFAMSWFLSNLQKIIGAN